MNEKIIAEIIAKMICVNTAQQKMRTAAAEPKPTATPDTYGNIVMQQYKGFIKAGFTEEQAFELTKSVVSKKG